MEAVEMKTVDNSLTCPNIDKNFWKNKKVLVTGCTGFKGSWLVTWLLEMGANIYGYSLTAPTNPSMFELLGLKNKINYKIGNVCDYTLFSEFLNQANPEIVFHLAAQPLVRYSYINPIETYSTNVLGLVHVLEAIRQNKQVKAVVNVTSDKCYENKEWHWGYRENEAMGGYDPYSNSKGCAELVTSCYRNSYFNVQDYGKSHTTLLASGRAGNVIGGGDWATDRLIVDIMHSFGTKTV
ncbi:MAG: rfbG [Burkholderiales bacterium]|nr:rfbG [Burkholderiales bacterium]